MSPDIPVEVIFLLPTESDRPWLASRGYFTLYETFLKECHLWFSFPAILFNLSYFILSQ
ncbi:hypothetical protein Bca101_016173 [Brassica carinata]